MTRIVTLLTEGFADWETALLNAVAHGFYGVETAFATMDGRPVTSSGGMVVVPQIPAEAIDPSHDDALILCGGTAWQGEAPPDVDGLVARMRTAARLVGAICDGTVALARTGALDGVAHTSNGVGHLDGTGYGGRSQYRDVPHAVTDGGIVTAPGTAPVSFMAEVMAGLGLADDNLAYYRGLHAAEHRG